MLTFSQIFLNTSRSAAARVPRGFVLATMAAAMTQTGCAKTAEPGESTSGAPTTASATPGATPSATSGAAAAPGPWAPTDGVRFSDAPARGDVKGIVYRELAQAQKEGRRVLVYVGATWCEPCQRFHHAATEGALDGDLGGLTLVQFDLDRDRDRLRDAGYVSDFIPLFTLPSPDGTATPHHLEGSIKGDGAVAQIVPRLQALLAQK